MPQLKFLLLPFAFLYGLATDLRNHLYDIGKRPSVEFDRFIISVGNLTAGGTGKTPFVELLVRSLSAHFRLALLSRGYRRKTNGYRLADENDNATTIGDEPFQYYRKFAPEVKVAVGEERMLAIPELLNAHEEIEVIIMDDAYQHRKVRRNFNVLLCDYNRPFYRDKVIPAGYLREKSRHADRADVVVVTKCPVALSESDKYQMTGEITKHARRETPVYFSSIRYMQPKSAVGSGEFSPNVYLFAGIADPGPLQQYVAENFNLLGFKQFSDHHSFNTKDIDGLIDDFEKLDGTSRCLLTTEKDMVRLLVLNDARLADLPVFYLPIEMYFIEKGDFFISDLIQRIRLSQEKSVVEDGL